MTKSRTPVTPVVDPAWTPRQQEVLALLAKGYTNGQIAQRLGITLDGAKFHVREILSKLGVDSREDAAAYWRERNSLRGRLSRAKRGLTAVVAWRVALTALLGVAVLVAGVAAALMLFGRGDDTVPAEATPTGTAAPTSPAPGPTSTPTATETAGGEPTAIPLTAGEEVDLPQDVVLIYDVIPCFRCGTGPNPHRAYVGPDGTLHKEQLFPRETFGDKGYPHSLIVAPDGTSLFALVCVSGYCGGEGDPTEDAELAAYRSDDGGVSWRQLVGPVIPPGSFASIIMGDQTLITTGEVTSQGWTPRFWLFPSGTEVTPPMASDPSDRVFATTLPNIGPVWGTTGASALHPKKYYSMDGELLFDTGRSLPDKDSVLDGLLPDGDLIVRWWEEGMGRAAILSPEGTLERVFAWPYDMLNLDGALSGSQVLGGAVFPDDPATHFRPSIIDFDTATVHPIRGFPAGTSEEDPWSYPRYAILAGPFARVTGAGTCLNVREEPSTTAAIRGCYADGVLLRTAGETQTGDGIEWLAVTTPAGDAGWASTEYIEY